VISLDWTVSPEFARRETAGRVALQGNLEPAVLYGTDECVREHTRRMIAAFGTQGYIVNLGHGMLPDHEPRAVGTLVDEVHAYSAKLIASDARR
jgi:uroporphyrinogen decarboxylase